MLTRTLAMKYFGTIDCLGQTLDINQIHPIRVTGIAEDPPSNATVKFVALASGKTDYGKLAMLDAAPQVIDRAEHHGVDLSCGCARRVAPNALAPRLHGFALAHYPSREDGEALFASLYLQFPGRLSICIRSTPTPTSRTHGCRRLYAVAATGLLILLLAGINFVNLVTARATRRAVEVGVRKGLGALRSQLMVQFMGESLGYSLAAMVLGHGLAITVPADAERLSRPADHASIFCAIRSCCRACGDRRGSSGSPPVSIRL